MSDRSTSWIGDAAPLGPDAFTWAAAAIGCEVAAIRAVWDVEAAGQGFRKDGSVLRRYEPHHFPGSALTWRDSLAIKTAQRDTMFANAYAENPEAALRATSWGAPQIMGFNHAAAGYRTAEDMVRHMADRESAHVKAFVRLVTDWGLDAALRAHDWRTFAAKYNGSGKVDDYAGKIEAAYRRHSGGSRSPQVLRLGDSGAAVERLQSALGVRVDGAFGAETDAAVRAFQQAAGLPVDGVVGKRTWAALAEGRGVQPKRQPTRADRVADALADGAIKAGTGALAGGALTEALDRAPQGAVDLAFYGVVGLALVAGAVLAGVYLFRRVRDA